MPPPRPKGIGFNTGATQPRSNSNTPMSERQQIRLIQMTATTSSTGKYTKSEMENNVFMFASSGIRSS